MSACVCGSSSVLRFIFPCSDSYTSCNLGQVDDVEALLPTLPHLTALEVARRMATEGMVGHSPLCTQLGALGARYLTSQDQQTVLEGEADWPSCFLLLPLVISKHALDMFSASPF